MDRRYCDFCERSMSGGHYVQVVEVQGTGPLGPHTKTFHICTARDGKDVGCLGFVNGALKEAGEKAKRALAERERELTRELDCVLRNTTD